MDVADKRNVNAGARPAEIEEPLNRLLIHPVARALLPMAVRSGIHPNLVSLSGIGFGGIAALAFHGFRDWRISLLGIAAMIGWHVCDGLDGMVARATGKSSDFGRFLDGVCDYSVFVLVYASVASASANILGAAPTWTLAAIAGAAHAVQAAWYEGQRELYVRRSRGDFSPIRRMAAGGHFEQLYNLAQERMTKGAETVDAWLREHPARFGQYQASVLPVLRSSVLFGATARTIGIGGACLLGLPFLYWIWELLLTPAMLVVNNRRRRREMRLVG